jgi:hypothetical protein
MKRIFVDFHHSSLLRSLHMLFDDRLHIMTYRPIGMEWFQEGYWAINDQEDTAKQFLSTDQAFVPGDGTPHLNNLTIERDKILGETQADGVYYCADPGNVTWHRACTLDFFKNNQFDYVLASIPAHVPLFRDLIKRYQPQAKLIFQVGNNWPSDMFEDINVLASVQPGSVRSHVNVMYYHQEFDMDIFQPDLAKPTRKIYSFVNILQNMPLAWSDFQALEQILGRKGFEFGSFGGQCRDGNMNGPQELANKMREAMLVFHVKEGGDGFGHIIYNAYATGRPIVTRSRFYAGKLAEELLQPGTYIDLDKMSMPDAANTINRLSYEPELLGMMSGRAANVFRKLVNYEQEAQNIKQWLNDLS